MALHTYGPGQVGAILSGYNIYPDAPELTEAQRAVLEPPYVYNRPLIEADGVAVVRPWREGN